MPRISGECSGGGGCGRSGDAISGGGGGGETSEIGDCGGVADIDMKLGSF